MTVGAMADRVALVALAAAAVVHSSGGQVRRAAAAARDGDLRD